MKTMKAMTNTGLSTYRVNRGSRQNPDFRDVEYIADADACQFGTVEELVAYLESLLGHTADEEGDLTWEDRNGRTFFTGAKARAHIAAEIAALRDGSHWSLTDAEWRKENADSLA